MRLFRTNTHYNDDGTTTVTEYDVSWEELRWARDMCLAELDVWYLADRWAQLSAEEQDQLNSYRQALRDLPQDNPDSPNDAVDNWPEPEDWF